MVTRHCDKGFANFIDCFFGITRVWSFGKHSEGESHESISTRHAKKTSWPVAINTKMYALFNPTLIKGLYSFGLWTIKYLAVQ